jgi:hypothetical protein
VRRGKIALFLTVFRLPEKLRGVPAGAGGHSVSVRKSVTI